MISVVIPSYNAENYIEKAINSVLAQTYQDFEIIVVDDGSVDNTKQAVERVKDPRIKYIYQPNSGPSVARNNGVGHSGGEYIAFLDADDVWHPEKLAIQHEIIEKNPGICLVFSSIEMINEKTGIRFIKRFKNYKDQETLLKNLLLIPMNIVPYPSTVLLKKEAMLRAGGFDPGIIVCEDWELWLRMAPIGNFYSVDKVLTTAIKPEGSLSSSSNLHKSFINNYNTLKKFFSSDNDYKKYENKAYASLFMNFGFHFFFAGTNIRILNILKNIIKSLLNFFK